MRLSSVVFVTLSAITLAACRQDTGKIDYSHLPDGFSNHSNYIQYKGWTHNKVFMVGDRGLGANRGVSSTIRDAFDAALRYCKKKNLTGCTVYDVNDVPLTEGIPAEEALKDFAAFEQKIAGLQAERSRDILQNTTGKALKTDELQAFLPDRFFVARTGDGAEMTVEFSADNSLAILNHDTGRWRVQDDRLCLQMAGTLLPSECLTPIWNDDNLAFFRPNGDAAFRLILKDEEGRDLTLLARQDALQAGQQRGAPFLASTGLTINPMLDLLETISVLPQGKASTADKLWAAGKPAEALALYAKEAAALEKNDQADLMVRSRALFIHGWRRLETGDMAAFVAEVQKSTTLLARVSESSGPVLHMRGRARRSIYGSLLAIGLTRMGRLTAAEQAIAQAVEDDDIFQRGIKNTGPYAMFLNTAEVDAGRRFSAATVAQAKGELALAQGAIARAEGHFLAALTRLGDPATFGDLKEVSANQLRERSRDLRRQYALLLSRMGKHGKALAQIADALKTSLQLGGHSHPETGASLIAAARILIQADRADLAEELLDARDGWPVHGAEKDLLQAVTLLRQQPDTETLAEIGALAVPHIHKDRPLALGLALYADQPDRASLTAIATQHAENQKDLFGPGHAKSLLAALLADIIGSKTANLHKLVDHPDIRQGVINWSLEERVLFTMFLDHLPVRQADATAALDILKLQQLAVQDPAQAAFARIAVQQSIDDPDLAALLRQEQDLSLQLAALNGLDAVALAQADISRQRDQLSRRYGLVTAKVKAALPTWQSENTGIDLDIHSLAGRIGDRDHILVSHAGPARHYSWLADGAGGLEMIANDKGAADIADLVRRIRRPMAQPLRRVSQLEQFDHEAAYQLWQVLFDGLQTIPAGHHLGVVAGRPLDRLPLGLLLKQPVSGPVTDRSGFLDRFAALPWMIRDHAIWRAPGLNALLYSQDRPGKADKAFLAFADPVFDPANLTAGDSNTSRGVSEGDLSVRALPVQAQPVTGAARGLASLPPLPDTGREVAMIADGFGGANSDLYLQGQASEDMVKKLNRDKTLAGYDTISFATHGLVAGDLPGLTMPALALSNPETNGLVAGQDGLLTMEEIFGLHLDSDLVILSACNSAANDGRGGTALSGLGRAFFHAGSRAMLASHWAVHSAATADLMVAMLKRKDQGMARARQNAILTLMDLGGLALGDGRVLSYSHPLFWAPFTLYAFRP